NGEIYNFRQLRAELEKEGCTFRGHSDTEVMLHAIERWGLEESLPKFSGMSGRAAPTQTSLCEWSVWKNDPYPRTALRHR
ncbi:MAG TPA: hypothetical protein DIU20_14570, partial [Cryomorphaceae bacterium]|nr:hypothetical protein [Cryomorphaceae bacterium]